MKVYVSELPKMCKECPCVKENLVVDMGTSWVDYYCKLQHKDNDHSWCYKLGKNLEEEYKQCPLVSIADYTKQVRKEVVDDLAISLVTCFSSDAEFTRDEIVDWLQKVKDQIQGETK